MKKILAILGIITCMIGLCACGQEETTETFLSEEEILEIGESTVEQINMIVDRGMVEQYANDSIIYSGLTGWQSALEDIGEFKGTNGGTVTVSGDEIVVDVNVAGSKHDAVVEIIFDGSMLGYVGIATNVEYSFGELMSKAALNTLIGMGTVFVVLIFISLIISCFGLINKTDVKKQDKVQTASVQSAAAADPVVAQIAEKEELAGDAELVAVIAAAIAAYEDSGSTDGFVVRSIRKSSKSKWQNA